MAMTRHDRMARSYYAYRLREQGYKTYADLLELFEFSCLKKYLIQP